MEPASVPQWALGQLHNPLQTVTQCLSTTFQARFAESYSLDMHLIVGIQDWNPQINSCVIKKNASGVENKNRRYFSLNIIQNAVLCD